MSIVSVRCAGTPVEIRDREAPVEHDLVDPCGWVGTAELADWCVCVRLYKAMPGGCPDCGGALEMDRTTDPDDHQGGDAKAADDGTPAVAEVEALADTAGVPDDPQGGDALAPQPSGLAEGHRVTGPAEATPPALAGPPTSCQCGHTLDAHTGTGVAGLPCSLCAATLQPNRCKGWEPTTPASPILCVCGHPEADHPDSRPSRICTTCQREDSDGCWGWWPSGSKAIEVELVEADPVQAIREEVATKGPLAGGLIWPPEPPKRGVTKPAGAPASGQTILDEVTRLRQRISGLRQQLDTVIEQANQADDEVTRLRETDAAARAYRRAMFAPGQLAETTVATRQALWASLGPDNTLDQPAPQEDR